MPKESRSNENEVKIYIDTCILQGAISGRKKGEDIVFLKKAEQKRWKVYTSIHTLMELFDVAKDRGLLIKMVFKGWVDVNKFLRERWKPSLNGAELDEITGEVNNFFINNKFIEFNEINEDVWNDVKEIVEKSNLHSSDALHLALAIGWRCNVLVTHDQFLVEEGNRILKEGGKYGFLRVCDVDKVEQTIVEVTPKRKRTLLDMYK